MKKFLIFLAVLSFAWAMSTAQSKDVHYFEGVIDKYPIEMYIFKMKYDTEPGEDNNRTGYSGYYVYNNHMIPLEIYQNTSAHNLTFEHHSQDENKDPAEKFSGTFDGKIYKGIWKKGKRELNFTLVEKPAKTPLSNKIFQEKTPLKAREDVYGTYTASFMLPEQKREREALMNMISDMKTSSFEEYTTRSGQAFKDHYLQEMGDYNLADEERSYSLRYSSTEYLTPYLNSGKYLIMQHMNHYYSGGAHGVYGSVYYNYSLEKGTFIRLEDVLDVSRKDEIAQVIKRCIKEKHGIPQNTPLDESENSIFISDAVTMPEIFTIHKNGISFYFSIYEITPYAHGEYSIFVPYDKLSRFMRSDFRY